MKIHEYLFGETVCQKKMSLNSNDLFCSIIFRFNSFQILSFVTYVVTYGPHVTRLVLKLFLSEEESNYRPNSFTPSFFLYSTKRYKINSFL